MMVLSVSIDRSGSSVSSSSSSSSSSVELVDERLVVELLRPLLEDDSKTWMMVLPSTYPVTDEVLVAAVSVSEGRADSNPMNKVTMTPAQKSRTDWLCIMLVSSISDRYTASAPEPLVCSAGVCAAMVWLTMRAMSW